MAIRFDALGDFLYSSTGLPALYPSTWEFKCLVVSDLGTGVAQCMWSLTPSIQCQLMFGDFGTTMLIGGYNGINGVGYNFASRPAVGQWVHIYVTIAGQGSNDFVGGWANCTDKSAYVTTSGALPGGNTNPTKVFYGTRNDPGGADYCDIRLVDIRCYNTVLSAANITHNRYHSYASNTANLVYEIPCRAGTVPSAILDDSGNGNNLTSNGTLTIETSPSTLFTQSWVITNNSSSTVPIGNVSGKMFTIG